MCNICSVLTSSVSAAQILALFTHWSACGFYFCARLNGFVPESLVGTNAPFFLSLSGAQQYIYSVYWAVQTLTSSEFGNPNPASIGETISASVRSIIFMGFNIVLGAYILGTITLLVVKADERTGRYRWVTLMASQTDFFIQQLFDNSAAGIVYCIEAGTINTLLHQVLAFAVAMASWSSEQMQSVVP